MLSYWKLDETSGTTYTDFFSGNDGTAVNAPTPIPTGQVSGAQSFDGVNDQISAPSNIIYDWAFNVSFSFEFWMNHSTSVPSSAEVIVGRKNDVSSNLAIWVGLDGSTGKITFSVRSKKTSIPVEDYFVQGPSLNDGLWHHVVAVRDASTNELRIYVDGVLKNSILTSYTEGFDAPSSQITIGWFDALDNAYRYNGIIDELAIYNSVLSPTQIQNDYYKGLNGLGYCDEGSVPIITSSPVLNGFLGQTYSYDVDATGNPTPTYSLIVYPTGMTISTTSGLIQWTTPTSIGNYSVTVSAGNGMDSPAIQSFTIKVSEVPECPANIISYWKLDETSGTTYTDFFSGNDGTAVNAPTPIPTGQVSGAQSFDGVNDQISAPSNIIYDWAFNVSFSFEFWMNHSTSVPSSAEVIVGRKNDVSSNLAIWVGLDGSTGKITFSVRSKKTSIPVEDYFVQGPSLNDGLWHHVVAVRDASTNELRIYVDGVLKNSILTSYTEGFDAPSSQITIGWFDALDNAYRYNGIIDELAIYNSVLSPTQIQNDYIKGLERKDYCDRFLLLASKVFLEGPYDEATSDVMFTNLNTNSLIPIISPYSQDPRTVDPIPADVVDWALVELRSTDVGSAVISKSVFLHKSGNLVADDGINQNIFFAVAPGNYYIVVKHRNHLGIMSAAPPVALSTSSTFYDFTTGSGQYYGGSAGAKLIDTSPSDVWGMIAGDGNGNGGISIDDLNLVWRVENGTIGYKNGDYNLNGGVSIDDRNLYWRLNNGTLSQVP